jgi:two-component system, NarL family, response regulator NreC
MTTIVLADDHAIVREGLRAALTTDPSIEIVGEAADGLSTVRLVEKLRPALLIVDVLLPVFGGIEVTRQVRQRSPQTRVIVFSMFADENYVVEALQSGAMAYVLKAAHLDDLRAALHAVQQGLRYLSPLLNERAISAYISQPDTPPPDPIAALTAREREILVLVAQGYTNAKIGAMLAISPRTVDTHRTRLMRKLDLHSQHAVARFARQHRLVPDTELASV